MVHKNGWRDGFMALWCIVKYGLRSWQTPVTSQVLKYCFLCRRPLYWWSRIFQYRASAYSETLRGYSHRFLSFQRHETNLYPSVESIGYPWSHWKEISLVIRFFDLVPAVTLYKALEVFGSKLSSHKLIIPGSKSYFKTWHYSMQSLNSVPDRTP